MFKIFPGLIVRCIFLLFIGKYVIQESGVITLSLIAVLSIENALHYDKAHAMHLWMKEMHGIVTELADFSNEYVRVHAGVDTSECAFSTHEEAVDFIRSTSVLPMIVMDEERKVPKELILCNSMSGKADYVDDMPREVSMLRVLPDGTKVEASYLLNMGG